MKKILLLLGMVLVTSLSHAQMKNFIDQPYLETQATIDTLVTPDRIHLTIILDEEDSRNRKSVEKMEADMIRVLKSLQINVDEDLTVADFDSNYRKYFLSSKKVLKSKVYKLIVEDAYTLSQVFRGLEEQDISNVSVSKTEHSKKDELLLALKSKAIMMAKQNADALVSPLDQKIVKAIKITDQSRFMYYARQSAMPEISMAMDEVIVKEKPVIQNINFQDLKFETTVNVIFAIE